MNLVRSLLLALAIAATAGSAHAATLFSPPIEVGGEQRCLECLIANVSDQEIKVSIRAYAEDGTPTDGYVSVIEPWGSTFLISHCDQEGNYTCEFDLLSGSRRRVRAAACEFILSLGCGAAVTAR